MYGVGLQSLAFLFLLNSSFEAEKTWRADAVDRLWFNGANWSDGSVPFSNQTVAIDQNGAEVDLLTLHAVSAGIDVGADATGVVLNVMSGGTLSFGINELVIAKNVGSEATVRIDTGGEISGAEMDVGGEGTGTLHVRDGALRLSSYLNVPGETGNGFVQLDGGVIEALNLYMGFNGGSGAMDLTGGELVLDGNQQYRMETYAATRGWITAFGDSGEGIFEWDYNETHPGKTTLRATSLDYGFAAPTNLYSVRTSNLNFDELTTLQTLSGIVAQKRPEIWIMGAGTGMWADHLETDYGIPFTAVGDVAPGADLEWMLNHFSDRYDGYILYDFAANPDSRTVATSLSGILKAVAVNVDLEAAAQGFGLSKTLDVTDKDHPWLYANYWDQFRHDAIMCMEPNKNNQDWCAALGMMNLWSYDSNWVSQVYSSVVEHSPIYGWGDPVAKPGYPYSEDSVIRLHSGYNLFQVVGGSLFNLPVYAGLWDAVLEEGFDQKISLSSAPVTNVHHVTFIGTGMANPVYLLNTAGWVDHTNRWASPYRGDFPVGWVMALPTVKLAAPVTKWFYDTAAPGMDNFVCGYSGLGYVHPSVLTDSGRVSPALNTYLDHADIHVAFIKDKENLTAEKARLYTQAPALRGGFCNTGNANYDSSIRWFDGVPFVNLRCSMRDDSGYTGLEIAQLVNALPPDAATSNGYSAIYFDVETRGLSDVKAAVDNFASHVRVVTPEEFIEQIRLNAVY